MNINKKVMVLGLVVVTLTSSLIGCKSKLEKIQGYLDNNDYTKAMKKVYLLQNEEDKEKADEMLKNKISDLEGKFVDKEIDGTLAISDIQKLRNDDVSVTIDTAIDEINTLMNSRKAFKNAVRNEDEGNLGEALTLYDEVSSYDTENYDNARNKVNELKSSLEEQNIVTIESSKVTVVSNKHKNLYPDQIQLILKNEGDKDITKFEVMMTAYDSEGNPTEIQGVNSTEKSYIFLGTGENISIKPGITWGKEYGWSLSENHNIAALSACIKNVEFSDGTTWDNPLYSFWLKNHYHES